LRILQLEVFNRVLFQVPIWKRGFFNPMLLLHQNRLELLAPPFLSREKVAYEIGFALIFLPAGRHQCVRTGKIKNILAEQEENNVCLFGSVPEIKEYKHPTPWFVSTMKPRRRRLTINKVQWLTWRFTIEKTIPINGNMLTYFLESARSPLQPQ
jgi:hypothetical protein